MRKLTSAFNPALTAALGAALALALGNAAHAAPLPPPDALPGTVHFDSGSSNVKARPGKKRKQVRRTGNATMNKNAMRDGTGKQ